MPKNCKWRISCIWNGEEKGQLFGIIGAAAHQMQLVSSETPPTSDSVTDQLKMWSYFGSWRARTPSPVPERAMQVSVSFRSHLYQTCKQSASISPRNQASSARRVQFKGFQAAMQTASPRRRGCLLWMTQRPTPERITSVWCAACCECVLKRKRWDRYLLMERRGQRRIRERAAKEWRSPNKHSRQLQSQIIVRA